MKHKSFLFLLLLLAGCKEVNHSTIITSMQTIDRNGFSETTSNKDRLKIYQNVDYLTAQPYQKVLRVYRKDNKGKSHSKLTSYHSNGGVWQYLEAIDGRANGEYLEWHENGKIKIRATIIEGLADLGEIAQKSWLFDDPCTIWNEQGNLEAEFIYDKGHLTNEAKYYFPNGKLQKVIPYTQGFVHGKLVIYDEQGNHIEEILYKNGQKEGEASGFWNPTLVKYQEQNQAGLLIYGSYFDPQSSIVAEVKDGTGTKAIFHGENLYSLISYKNGSPEGEIKNFSSDGNLQSSYMIYEGKKTGSEWQYYPPRDGDPRPKIMISWHEDKIQGMVKTWYENGVLESQREMSANKKQGLSFAYYKSGDLMLMEEYENNRLLKGSYHKKGEPNPVSTIEAGSGIATLHNAEGFFLQKIVYERGKPLID